MENNDKTPHEILIANAVQNQTYLHDVFKYGLRTESKLIGANINIMGKLIIESIDRLTAAIEKLTPKE